MIDVGPPPDDGRPRPCVVCGNKLYRPLTWDGGKNNHWVCATPCAAAARGKR